MKLIKDTTMMQNYNSIKYIFNTRTKRYTIYIKNALGIKDAVKKILGRSATNLLIIKEKVNQFDVYDFFMLELEYALDTIKETRPDLAVELGGIVINDLMGFIKTKTWLADRESQRSVNILNYSNIKAKMKFPPLPHQIGVFTKYESIKRLANLSGMLMDMGAGAGKTYSSLALAEALEYNNVIIVAPNNTLDDVWVKSVRDELYRAPQTHYVMDIKNKNYSKERFLILSYETLDKLAKDKKLLRALKRLKPMLIVDEFHNFNNIDSLRTNNLLTIVNKIKFEDIVLLTGTPVKMDLKEMKPMLYILDNKFKPIVDRYDDFYRGKLHLFRNRFDVYRERISKDTSKLPKIELTEHKVTVPDGDRFTLATINKEVTEFKVERLSAILDKMDIYDAMFETILNNVVATLMTNGIGKVKATGYVNDYRRLVKTIRKHSNDKKLFLIPNIIVEARELEASLIIPNLTAADKATFKNIRSIKKYPELKVLGEALAVLLRKRIECYDTLAKYLNYKNFTTLTNKKCIIFSSYVSTCKIAVKETSLLGYSPLGVYGDATSKLPIYVKKFNDLEDPSNPIVATYKSLSTGVPLLAGNVMILLDTPLRNYLLDQSVSRAWRIGQDKPVMVFMIKLDTGNVFNITDRDHFILNLSTQNVETITGNMTQYDIPEQMLETELDDGAELEEDDDTSEAIKDIEEEIISDMVKPLTKLMSSSNTIYDPILGVTDFIRNIKFKL